MSKNTKPYKNVDPKTGKEGTTIPDGMERGQTTEIKNVQRLSDSRQLRLQKKISNSNGKKPRIVINRTAKISKTIKDGGYDIQYYDIHLSIRIRIKNNKVINVVVKDNKID